MLIEDLEYIHKELCGTNSLQVMKAILKLEEVIGELKPLIDERSHASECQRDRAKLRREKIK